MLAILDYDSGNQTSVNRALASLGVEGAVTAEADRILAARGVIFPGVGAAGQAMGHLKARGLDRVLRQVVELGIPLLGICLGCQILLEHSEEGDTRTLGILPGRTRCFDPTLRDEAQEKITIPHMGWNGIARTAPSRLFDGIDQDSEFYFVHSYYVEPDPALVLGTTRHGLDFCSLYGRDGLWAAQFHAEKSGRPGLRLLRNFADYCRENAHAR
jgi:glutamine amidotransferase